MPADLYKFHNIVKELYDIKQQLQDYQYQVKTYWQSEESTSVLLSVQKLIQQVQQQIDLLNAFIRSNV